MNARTLLRVLCAVLLPVLLAGPVSAHELRPAYLELEQTGPGNFVMLWKVPARGEAVLRLEPVLPAACEVRAEGAPVSLQAAVLERSLVACPAELDDLAIRVEGLEATMTDVLVRVRTLDGERTSRLTAARPAMTIAGPAGLLEVSHTYLVLGVEHILLGIDHLLFVFGLLLLVEGARRLLWTITAFTLAHSLTLAAATFGLVGLSPALIEALIALSIVLIAVEVVRKHEGEHGLGSRMPWLVAFAFGLLHGLGFAGALTEIGLPDHAVVPALALFNIGVELGQILIVGAVLVALRLLAALELAMPRIGWRFATYTIGGLGAFWTFERLSRLL